MKITPFLTVSFLVLFSCFAFADNCSSGTLSTYLSAGFSCSIGDKTFSAFSYTADGSSVAASGITVAPQIIGNEIGLAFTGSWQVTAGMTQTPIIQLSVSPSSGFLITDAQLLINSFGFSGTGSLTINGTLGNGDALSVFASNTGAKPFDSLTFTGVSGLSVVDSITLSGGAVGTVGSAGVGTVTNLFSQTQVPEPAGVVLLGSGFMALCCTLRRKLKQ